VAAGVDGADGAGAAAAISGAGAGATGSGAGGGTMSAARRRRTPAPLPALVAAAGVGADGWAPLPFDAALSVDAGALAVVLVVVAGLEAAAGDVAVALLRRRAGWAGFSARARFSRSHRARTRATCSSESGLVWLRTGTSIERSKFITSSAEMPNSLAMSLTRLLTPTS
jgi:hypothetical protein